MDVAFFSGKGVYEESFIFLHFRGSMRLFILILSNISNYSVLSFMEGIDLGSVNDRILRKT